MSKSKLFILGVLCLLLSIGIGGCGASGGDGLNGAMEVNAEPAAGGKVTATAKFTSPGRTNYIGVPVTFYVKIGDAAAYKYNDKDYNFGPSGIMSITVEPTPFNGKQTVTVIAISDKVPGQDSVEIEGRSMSLTPPDTFTQTTTAATGTTFDVTIPASSGFVAITDPFSNAQHNVTITADVTSTSGTATITPTTTAITWSNGDLLSPATVVHFTVPALLASDTATITWTVTDVTSGLVRTGSTVVTLTKSA